jgi:hypothetical protein
MEVAGANRGWRWQFRCRGSRRESAVAQLSRPLMRLRRAIIFGLCAVPVLMLMTFYLFVADDIMPQDPPLTFTQAGSVCVCLLVLWPFEVTYWLLRHYPAEIYWMPLWLVTGLFWGVVVEFFMMVKRRLWPNQIE